MEKNIINHIYSLRNKFIVIGLTGRTGSGCTTVANLLSQTDKIGDLKSKHSTFRNEPITNQARKDRIVYEFIKENWNKFIKITASDTIYYFAFQMDFEEFKQCVFDCLNEEVKRKDSEGQEGASDSFKKFTMDQSADDPNILNSLNSIKEEYESLNKKLKALDSFFEKEELDELDIDKAYDTLLKELPDLRRTTENLLGRNPGLVSKMLQTWGNNLRKYGKIVTSKDDQPDAEAPTKLAEIINKIIKVIRSKNGKQEKNWIVIDALRNPFEILFFRERYSAFYCMSVNTEIEIRHNNLLKRKNFTFSDVQDIDEKEKTKDGPSESFSQIDIDKCIELSDIHLSHDGVPTERNEKLINQILTYIALILHPGLVPPTPEERLMQVAYTAKLNSGCLSRQVGAALTGPDFALKSIGWNSVPQGQVPCSLRQAEDLWHKEDEEAFSDYESFDSKFQSHQNLLKTSYSKCEYDKKLQGLPITYCFKDIYTNIVDKQRYNQVHTRSLHAEENAFLQISKYGGIGLEGGKLFTTASCCELCAKKAYQLGIREIYYVDSYPGISEQHVLRSGVKSQRPKTILFSGVVGRAYVSLYTPFMPRKDEIEELTGINVKSEIRSNNTILNEIKNGGNN